MTDWKINGKPSYQVTKDGPAVATIYFVDEASLATQGGGVQHPHWVLKNHTGRIDRHPTLDEAKSDAMKL
ncbi:TPA: hypothetical protein ACP32N_005120 [Pseudomonas aeruginosa]